MPTAGDRGVGVNLPANSKSIGLPPRVFLFTVDQIATMLDVSVRTLMDHYLFFEGRSVGSKSRDLIIAIDITPRDSGLRPDWRISEREFTRWMKHKRFRYYERGAYT